MEVESVLESHDGQLKDLVNTAENEGYPEEILPEDVRSGDVSRLSEAEDSQRKDQSTRDSSQNGELEEEADDSSLFGRVPPARETSQQLLEAMFENDMSGKKVFLAARGFRTNESRCWYLPVVRTVETQIAEDLTLHKEFTRKSTGLQAFVNAACRLILGADSPAFVQNRVAGIQTPGGSAAVYVGLHVLRKIYNFTSIYIPQPTTGIYREIATQLEYDVRDYQFLDPNNQYLDMERFLASLENAEEESIVVFHIDTSHKPSSQGWYHIVDIVKRRHLFPLFHVNGQGLSSGDLYLDAFPVRLFVAESQDLMVAQSFSKIFGLGDEKVANVCIVGPDAEETRILTASLRALVNSVWGYSPTQAARIVVTIINNPALAAEWKEHIRTMAERVRMLRVMFFQKLLALGTAWNHVNVQTGMYLSTGLKEHEVDILRNTYHIYMNSNGIINLSCLTSTNLDYVTRAIHEVVTAAGSTTDSE